MTEQTPDAQIETTNPETVMVWHHSRKGWIIGVPVAVIGDWTDIRLVGDHELRYMGQWGRDLQAAGLTNQDGMVERFRTSFLTAPVPYDPEVHGER